MDGGARGPAADGRGGLDFQSICTISVTRSRDILVNPRSGQRAGGGGPSRPFITRDDGKVPLRRSRASPDALSIVPSLVNGKEQGFQVMWAARFGRAVADERRI
jgi:hypothetical protein